jgi:hypothetical protein
MSPQPGSLPSKPRQSAIVYETADSLAQDPGPATDIRYAVVLELGPQIFKWWIYASDTADDVNVIAPSGGTPGRWKRARFDDSGEDLGDANVTLLVSGGATRVVPPATLTAGRTLTLGTTGAAAGDEMLIVRNDAEAFAVTVVNGGAGAGNVAVMPSGSRAWCRARFDGTDWIHVGSGLALGTS